jgi:hypothetical protein
MIERFSYFIRFFLFWILFFVLLRIVFLIYFFKLSLLVINDWLGIFLHGLRLDLAITGYLCLFPLFILIFSNWIVSNWPLFVIKVYSIVLVIFNAILSISDLGIFKEWGYRMDASPILYLANPQDAFASVSISFIVAHLLLGAAISVISIYAFNKFTASRFKVRKRPLLTSFLLILTLGSMIVRPISAKILFRTRQQLIYHGMWFFRYSIFNPSKIHIRSIKIRIRNC